MPGVNRHRPPTVEQLFARVYRRQLVAEKLVLQLQAEVARLSGKVDLSAKLRDHCRRLLTEKPTLLRVIEANQFMAAALPRRHTEDSRI